MTGVVIDLGGKRKFRRGTFAPPVGGGTTWTYVNLDPDTAPDILCDVTAVPWSDATVDCVVCTEVLEHVPDPAACVREAARLLRPGGFLICSVPFMYPVHADPADFQRFTADGLRHLFRSFQRVQLHCMDGYLGVLGMFVEFGGRQVAPDRAGATLLRRTLFETGRMLQWLDLRWASGGRLAPSSVFTTGYFAIAQK